MPDPMRYLEPDDPEQPIRQEATDSLVHANRKRTPPGVVNQREKPRYSVAELNNLDMDQVRQRFAQTKFDDRSSFVQVMDVLDLPRNTLAGLIAPSIRRRKEAEGETGTFGQGKVYAADILKDLGVQNRVVRGIAGFVGDVALDPLTYIGPPGWGARSIASGGKALTLTKRFVKAANEGAKAFEAGGRAAEPLVHEFMDAYHALSPIEKGKAGEVLLGGGRTRGNKLLRTVGADIETQGSPLAEYTFKTIDETTPAAEARVIRAAKAIEAKFSRTNAPGIRLGPKSPGGEVLAGTGYLHIPFTDIGVYGPAITGRAREAQAASVLAREVGDPARKVEPLTTEGLALDNLGKQMNERVARAQDISRQIGHLDAEDLAIGRGEAANIESPSFVGPGVPRDVQRQTLLGSLREEKDAVAGLRDEMRGILQGMQATSANNGAILHAANVWKARAGQAKVLEGQVAEAEATHKQARAIFDAMSPERDARINERVRAERGAHELKQDAGRAARDLEAEQVREANRLDEQQRIMTGEQDHPVLGPRPFLPEPPPYQRVPFDEAAARFRVAGEEKARYAQRFTEEADKLVAQMSPESIEAAGHLQDALAARMEGYHDIADAAAAPLIQTMSAKDRAIGEAAAMALGFAPEEIGYSPFGGLKNAADALFNKLGDSLEGKSQWVDAVDDAKFFTRRNITDVESGLRRVFGNKSGTRNQIIRGLARSQNPLMTETAGSYIREMEDGIKAAMTKHEIPLDKAATVRRAAFLMLDADRPLAQGDRVNDLLKEVSESGLFTNKREFLEEVKAVAQTAKERLEQLPAMEGGAFRADYGAPSRLTQEARKLILKQKANAGKFVGTGPKGEQVARIIESYEKPRSMVEFRFPSRDAEGNVVEKSFLEADRVYSKFSDADLRALTDDARAYAEGKRAVIDEFDKLPYSERPQGTSLSRAEVNQRVREGKLAMLTGGVKPEQFFDEDIVAAVAHRFGQSERANLRKYGLEWARSKGVILDTQKIDPTWQGDKNGATVRLRNGAMARLENSGGSRKVWIGDQRFRTPNAADNLKSLYDPTDAVYNTKLYQSYYPEEVADLIEHMGKPFQTDEDVGRLVRAADTASRIWKGVTLLHPSWTINDIMGNLILAAYAGVNIDFLIKHLPAAFRIVRASNRGDRQALEEGIVNLGARSLKYGESVRPGVQAAGAAVEGLRHVMRDQVYVGDTGLNLFRNPKEWANGIKNRALDRAQLGADAGRVAEAGNMLKNVTGMAVKDGVVRGIWQPWARINGMANDWIRTAAFLSFVEQGYDLEAAARRVADKMLDMSTLTDAEQSIRKFVPFYSWLKNSGVYGMRQLLENPKFFTLAPHLKRNLEEAANGEANIPEHLRPSWVRDQLALQIGTDPNSRHAILLGTALPSETATHILQGLASPALGQAALQDSVAYFGNSVTPLVKIPAEVTAGREFYTKREISGDPDRGDLTLGEYALGQIRPAKELGIGGVRQGPIQKSFGQGVGSGIARLTLGGRVQPFDDERIKFNNAREAKVVEQSIRKRISIAEREGDKEASLRARVQLLHLYDNMRRKGLDVPKKLGVQAESLSSSRP